MLTRIQQNALAQLETLWPGRCVLIGASALVAQRPHHLWRATKDIDVLVAGNFDEVERATDLGWSRDPRRLHRWYLPEGGWVDLVPAGPEAQAAGELVWPDGQVMRTAGLHLAFEHAVVLELPGVRFRVAPLPVLLILKVIAFSDRPDRRHDLGDIAGIVHAYVGDDDERRWDANVPHDLSFEATGAYLLGRDVASLVPADLVGGLHSFCETILGTPLELTLSQMAPVAWRDSETATTERIAALQLGLGPRPDAG